MQNPFKAGDAVLTKVKQREVQATVTTVWKNEVQVKTADGDLLWRTMYTVRRAGEEPLKREAKTPAAAVIAPTDAAAVPAEQPSTPEHKRSAAPEPKGRKAAASKSQRRKRR